MIVCLLIHAHPLPWGLLHPYLCQTHLHELELILLTFKHGICTFGQDHHHVQAAVHHHTLG